MLKRMIVIAAAALALGTASAQTEADTDSRVNTLLRQLDEKQQEIDKLNGAIEALNSQAADLQNEIQRLSRRNSELEQQNIGELDGLRAKIDELHSVIDAKNDTLRWFTALDNTIYRQCLLYPLERRYDAKRINDAIHCIDVIDIKGNHKKEYDTYAHFLSEYERYNLEIINYLEAQKKSLGMKGWVVNDMVRAQADEGLKRTAYYRYYEKRDTDPWESILYLDETIDQYLNLLKKDKIAEADLQHLIDRLQPK